MQTNIVIWIIIIVIGIIIFIGPVMMVGAENMTSITYVSNIDPDLGFYKVTDSTLHNQAPYKDRILTINQGDTVIWKNDADKPSNITVVSNQKLFPDKLLRLMGDVSSFMFDRPGKYIFYLKERETMKQTIIVNAIEGYQIHISDINTPTPTIMRTSLIDNNTIIKNITNIKQIEANISVSRNNETNVSRNNETNVSRNNETNVSRNNETNVSRSNEQNVSNGIGTKIPVANILFAIYSKIDIGYIINNYIAGVLAIATYVICKKRFLKQ